MLSLKICIFGDASNRSQSENMEKCQRTLCYNWVKVFKCNTSKLAFFNFSDDFCLVIFHQVVSNVLK